MGKASLSSRGNVKLCNDALHMRAVVTLWMKLWISCDDRIGMGVWALIDVCRHVRERLIF